jgi:hypothetical protein
MILEIVAIVLLFLIILLSAFLMIPFRVVLDASFSLESTRTNFALSWLGLTLYRTKPSAESKKESKKKEEPEKKKKRTGPGEVFRMFSLFRDSIPAFMIFARSARRALNIRRIDLRLAFGSDDPAETAFIAGCMWSFSWLLNLIPRVSIQFRPVLDSGELNGTFNTEVKVRALPLVVGFLRAYLKKPFRQFIKEVRAR